MVVVDQAGGRRRMWVECWDLFERPHYSCFCSSSRYGAHSLSVLLQIDVSCTYLLTSSIRATPIPSLLSTITVILKTPIPPDGIKGAPIGEINHHHDNEDQHPDTEDYRTREDFTSRH